MITTAGYIIRQSKNSKAKKKLGAQGSCVMRQHDEHHQLADIFILRH
jgi:hypothetical protein